MNFLFSTTKNLLPTIPFTTNYEIEILKEDFNYKKLMCSGSKTESALVKMRLSKKPPAGAEDYSYFQYVWDQEKVQSSKDYLR